MHHVDVSFRRAEQEWTQMDLGVGGPVSAASFLVGDDLCGPVFTLWALPPDIVGPPGPAHGHASDSWRIAMRGTVPVGQKRYAGGGFRIQAGWRPYGTDNFAYGPEGGWLALMFADRRGTRVRPVKDADEPAGNEANEGLAAFLGITKGDLIDPNDSSGPAAVATTLGAVGKTAHLDGSFADAQEWRSVGASRYTAALMGEPTVGPAVFFVSTAAGEVSTPTATFGCEVVRFVVDGGCTIDGQEYLPGDVRVQPKGGTSPAAVAGSDGLHEIFIISDRRHVVPTAAEPGGWIGIVAEVATELAAQLEPAATSAEG